MRTIAVAVALALTAPALTGCLGEAGPDVGAGDDEADPQAPVDPGWPPVEQATIRPGVTIASGSCTANFVFHSLDNRTLFIGTAAHCFPDAEIGDPVEVAGGAVQGRLAYSSFLAMEENGDSIGGNDLALVELLDEARDRVHPAMLSFGGPTGIAETAAPGDQVFAHGNSTARPDATPGQAGPREGVVTEHGTWTTGVYFAGPGVPGDSGSPAITADGQALGVVITFEVAPQPASNNLANLDAALGYANEHMDESVELATWPPTEDGSLPAALERLGGPSGALEAPEAP